MSRFQQGQRVVVKPPFGIKEHGKIISIDKGLMTTTMEVSLDNGDSKKYPPGDLSIEELTPEEVVAEIKKVRSQVDKVAPQLSGEMAKELPNYLRFLAEYQASNDKNGAAEECRYVASRLETQCKNGFVTKDWWENTRIGFEKIYWAMKDSPL